MFFQRAQVVKLFKILALNFSKIFRRSEVLLTHRMQCNV